MHISFNRHRSTVHVRQPLSPLGKVVFCIIFSLVGLGLLIGAYFLSRNTREFLAVSKHARGEVIDMIREESTSGTGSKRRTSSTYFPEIRFTSEDGVTVEFRGSSGSNPPSYHRGQSIDVLYNPSSPHDARINGWFELWGGAVICCVIGVVFLLIGTLPALFFGVVLFAASKSSRRSGMPPPPPVG
jgi:hypothetical protein